MESYSIITNFHLHSMASNTTNRFFIDRKKPFGSRNRSATLGRSQFRNSVSGRRWAGTVLPTRRGPGSQTMDA